MASPKVISIIPNRNLFSPKVILVTLGVMEGFAILVGYLAIKAGYFAIRVGYCPIRVPYSFLLHLIRTKYYQVLNRLRRYIVKERIAQSMFLYCAGGPGRKVNS